MIKYCNFEIYISLDRSGISKLIETWRNYEDASFSKVKESAEKLHTNIFNFKANLRKFYMINGQARMLNRIF